MSKFKKIFMVLSVIMGLHMLSIFCFAMETTPSHKLMPLRFNQKKATITLYPRDADLRYADNVIVEPKSAPYNLGGWRTDNTVAFPLEIKESGEYIVNIYYSKDKSVGSTGELRIGGVSDLSINLQAYDYIDVNVPFTGNSWSTYKTTVLGSLKLPQGKVYLVFMDQKNNAGQYVMNLREVRLEKK